MVDFELRIQHIEFCALGTKVGVAMGPQSRVIFEKKRCFSIFTSPKNGVEPRSQGKKYAISDSASAYHISVSIQDDFWLCTSGSKVTDHKNRDFLLKKKWQKFFSSKKWIEVEMIG